MAVTLGLVHVVDDDEAVREMLSSLLRSMGYDVRLYASAADFLQTGVPDRHGCIILDVRLPGGSGLDLQSGLHAAGIQLPVILMTAFADVPMTIRGMRAGAVNFLTKPFRDQDLLDAVIEAVAVDVKRREAGSEAEEYLTRIGSLSPRERQVLDLVVEGLLNKQIAERLGIQEVTVKLHRAAVMRKVGAGSIIELGRIAETVKTYRNRHS
jgi:FixJ family two-component response regulator